MTRLWRVRERSTFAALRRDGVRRRVDPLTVTFLPPDSSSDGVTEPAVAFAIPRSVGSAVVRNRLRRRLRSAIAEIDPAPGTYLISARPGAAAVPYQDLRALLGGGTT